MQINAVIQGERDIALRLEQMPQVVHQRLLSRIGALTARLYAAVEEREPRRTGKLTGETVEVIDETPDLVRGRVRVAARDRNEWGKAAALEYGAHGSVTVRAYQRQGHTPRGTPAQQMVEAYQRRVNIPERRYERGALEGMRGEIKADLEQVLQGL